MNWHFLPPDIIHNIAIGGIYNVHSFTFNYSIIYYLIKAELTLYILSSMSGTPHMMVGLNRLTSPQSSLRVKQQFTLRRDSDLYDNIMYLLKKNSHLFSFLYLGSRIIEGLGCGEADCYPLSNAIFKLTYDPPQVNVQEKSRNFFLYNF